jgi:hypothetical protein
VTADTWVRDIPTIRDRYPVRLLNSLGKVGANTVEEVQTLDAVAFAAAHGVGATQVRLLDELKTELRELLVPNDTRAGHRATCDGSPGDQGTVVVASPEQVKQADQDEPDAFDALQLDALWEVWSQLPVPLRNCLGANGVRTVAEVLEMEPADFAELRGVGAKRVQAFSELRETLRYMRLQQGIDAAHGSRAADPASPTPETAAQPAPEATTRWASLEALLRDVAARVSANRTHTAEKDRNLEIWLSYHGLGPAVIDRTLDAVGAIHGLTRERVRQIVTRLTRIVADEIARSTALAPFRLALQRTMGHCLGFARAGDMAELLAQEMDWEQAPSIELVETLDEIVSGTPLAFGYRHGEALVEHADVCTHLRQRVQQAASALVQEIHETEHILDFVYHLTQACRNGKCQLSRSNNIVPCCGGATGQTTLPTAYVLAIASELEPSPLDGDRVMSYVWTRLRTRWPKSVAVHAGLEIIGHPVDHSELTAFICKHNPAFDTSDDRYVLSQLRNRDEYAALGKGVFGLCEWASDQHSTAEDLIEELLRARGKDVHQRGIVRSLRAQGVPSERLYVALEDSRFLSNDQGWVRLAEWDQGPQALPSGSSPVPVLIGDDEDAGYIL